MKGIMPSRFVRLLFLALVPALLIATASGLPPSNGGSSPPLVVSASRLVSMRHGFFRTGYGFRWFPLGMSWVDGSTHGKWRDQFDGYGRVGVRTDGARVLSEIPKAPMGPSDTHAALVTSLRTFGNLDLILRMRTLRQLRWPGPNPWEVAWVLWHYTDSTHFYYLILKPNGWELGKEDPAYPDNQR